MSAPWKVAIRVVFCVAFGLGILAAAALAPGAGARAAAAANTGIVGMAINLTADTVGAPAPLVVRAVAPGDPAQRAGVQPGDEIVAIDGQSTTGKSLSEIVHMIRGKVGTAVRLTLSHKGQRHEVSLIRVEAVGPPSASIAPPTVAMSPLDHGVQRDSEVGLTW